MAMGVDFSTPLTDEERAFLNERGRYADIERADSTHGSSAPEGFGQGDGTGPEILPVMTSEVMADRKRRLQAELAAIEEAEGDAGADSDDDTDVPPYEAWNVSDLDAEIKRRNEAGANLETGGKKDEKVARLYADDES